MDEDLIPTSYVKVTHHATPTGRAKSVYLEQPKYIKTPPLNGSADMIAGYEVDKKCEAKTYRGGAVLHLIQLGEGVTVVPQMASKMYGDLHDSEGE